MAGLFDRFRRRLSDEIVLFRVSHPEFQDPGHSVGSLVEHGGVLYVVTRWVELPPVPLNRGGSVAQWDVYGRPADDAEVEVLVAEAADRLLSDRHAGDGEEDGR